MTATARYIRLNHPGSKVVFIGPCIAKKQEIVKVKDSADYVITFEELAAMFAARQIEPERVEDPEQDASRYGKGFAVSGGVAGAVERVLEEEGFTLPASCKRCNGAKEVQEGADDPQCRKAA